MFLLNNIFYLLSISAMWMLINIYLSLIIILALLSYPTLVKVNFTNYSTYLIYYWKLVLLVILCIHFFILMFFIKTTFLWIDYNFPALGIFIVTSSYYTTQNLFYLSMVLHIIFFYIFIFTTIYTFFNTIVRDFTYIYVLSRILISFLRR